MICYIHKNIQYLFQKNSLTAETIADKTGIALNNLTDFISGISIPDVASAITLADFFKLPIELLLIEDIEKKESISKRFEFKFLVLDVDGVMTDGGIIYTENGDEIKKFNAKDGLAIIRLITAGMKVGFLSSGFTNGIIEKRAAVLGVPYVYVGTWKKLDVLKKWCNELNIEKENIAYIGDDLNDLSVIDSVGLSACPSDAPAIIKNKVNIVLSAKGGKACVREFVDTYLIEYMKNAF